MKAHRWLGAPAIVVAAAAVAGAARAEAPKTVDHKPPDARVSFIKNDVEAFTPGEHKAHVEESLVRGNRVDTLADSAAEITYADDSRLQLGEHTLVVILG